MTEILLTGTLNLKSKKFNMILDYKYDVIQNHWVRF